MPVPILKKELAVFNEKDYAVCTHGQLVKHCRNLSFSLNVMYECFGMTWHSSSLSSVSILLWQSAQAVNDAEIMDKAIIKVSQDEKNRSKHNIRKCHQKDVGWIQTLITTDTIPFKVVSHFNCSAFSKKHGYCFWIHLWRKVKKLSKNQLSEASLKLPHVQVANAIGCRVTYAIAGMIATSKQRNQDSILNIKCYIEMACGVLNHVSYRLLCCSG